MLPGLVFTPNYYCMLAFFNRFLGAGTGLGSNATDR